MWYSPSRSRALAGGEREWSKSEASGMRHSFPIKRALSCCFRSLQYSLPFQQSVYHVDQPSGIFTFMDQPLAGISRNLYTTTPALPRLALVFRRCFLWPCCGVCSTWLELLSGTSGTYIVSFICRRLGSHMSLDVFAYTYIKNRALPQYLCMAVPRPHLLNQELWLEVTFSARWWESVLRSSLA